MTTGIDVSKEKLAVHDLTGMSCTVPNSERGIAKLLASRDPGSIIAMEATGRYHKLLADMAFHQGFRVVVFNPKDVLHYAKSVSPRAKTDAVDARVIASYAHVRSDYRVYKPISPDLEKLRDLIRTRSLLIKNKIGLENKMRDCAESLRYLEPVVGGIGDCIARLDKDIDALASEFKEYKLLSGISGVGPITAAYLVVALSSGQFRTSDSFVAFLGLDIRVKQSGKKIGKSCLSKRGDPEGRRLLYLCAQAAARTTGPYAELYDRYCNNGLSKIAAAVSVARKLARTAWAIYNKQTPYCRQRVLSQETTTLT
jgi:transposase